MTAKLLEGSRYSNKFLASVSLGFSRKKYLRKGEIKKRENFGDFWETRSVKWYLGRHSIKLSQFLLSQGWSFFKN